VVLLSAAVDSLPLVALLPVHPPEAVQLVASVVDQVSIAVPFGATVPGSASNVTVGSGGGEPFTITLTERCSAPPAPVQRRLKVRL
jgi:hypothetical protein